MDRLLTLNEAGELRGVTRAAIHYLVKMKRIRSVRKYGRVLVYRTEVINYTPLKAGRPPKLSIDTETRRRAE
jgi:hypothetical protein